VGRNPEEDPPGQGWGDPDLLDFFSRAGGIGLIAPAGHANGLDVYLARIRQGSPATGMAMGVIAISVSMLSICFLRRLVPKKP